MFIHAIRTGSPASQLGLGVERHKARKRSSVGKRGSFQMPKTNKNNEFVSSVLEESVRTEMAERDAKMRVHQERVHTLHRVSTLYNVNRKDTKILHQMRGVTRSKTVSDFDGWEIDSALRPQTAKPRKVKEKVATKSKQSKEPSGWRLGGWRHPSDFNRESNKTRVQQLRPQSACERRPSRAVQTRRDSQRSAYKTASAKLASKDDEACHYCEKYRRPKSAGERRVIVAGEIRKTPAQEVHELMDMTILVPSELSPDEILDRLNAPRKDRERRLAMQEQVAEAFRHLPRLRSISSAKIRRHLESAGSENGEIDRGNFITAVRGSGLTNQVNLASRAFSSFDLDADNQIQIDDFVQFYANIRRSAVQQYTSFVFERE